MIGAQRLAAEDGDLGRAVEGRGAGGDVDCQVHDAVSVKIRRREGRWTCGLEWEFEGLEDQFARAEIKAIPAVVTIAEQVHDSVAVEVQHEGTADPGEGRPDPFEVEAARVPREQNPSGSGVIQHQVRHLVSVKVDDALDRVRGPDVGYSFESVCLAS